MNQRNLTLLTDFYELTMMQGYFKEKNVNETVIFDAFYRNNPNGNGYAICAGLEQVIEYIDNLHFTKEDVDYLRSTGMFEEDFLEYLSQFHFSGDIYAVPEGTVVFPREPLVKVIAPIMEAQLIETALLNIINHQSLIATKTARVIHAAQGDGVMEFGLRRAQGPDAGIYGARAAMIAGCIGTSNVLAGQMFDVPVKGTHAHSWIMSFPDELTAFRTYAKLYPSACILLVDTYDTLKSGIPNAIKVFQEMKEAGIPLTFYGIRLDSGDLAYLSKEAKKMLDQAGFPDAVISASNDLDEYLIDSLKAQGATINSWGVGTNMITSKDCPSFGGVYKLAAVKDKATGKFVSKIKLSENAEKITNPGNKSIQRIYQKNTGKIIADLICLTDEKFDSRNSLLLFDPIETWKKTHLAPGSYTLRQLLVPVFKEGACVYHSPKVMEIQEYCKKELDTLWDESRRLINPHEVHVDLSNELWHLKNQLLDSYHFKE
ncbi:nicotinate phosphoribosyltransferase [Lachnoclostridium edouardi]|uniref:nicotinate phosphoribosyltransferase n=1 Tax=Lachnoclostridium edouardi TaxID=1926283 RepID=UPI000C7E4EC4|nr:nicotinate phosphoribosyltransferase [Lachnoclostridium edouardi]MDO4277234.1 nicotinate phosphoribosyltransferase [Lachnoclostridium edouardi]